LVVDTPYYWRVDVTDPNAADGGGAVTYTGDVWEFSIPACGTNPDFPDLSGDCFVDSEDLVLMASQWIDVYDNGCFALLAKQWLTTLSCWLVIPENMLPIPAGTFAMGDHHDGYADALPIHNVTLDSFYMDKYEITNQQYCDYLNYAWNANEIKLDYGAIYKANDTGNQYKYLYIWNHTDYSQIKFDGNVFTVNFKSGQFDMSDHCVIMISWRGAIAYCNWRSQQEGFESCYNLDTGVCDFSKHGYRLPTEAEREYASRGGHHNPYYRYPWGTDYWIGEGLNSWDDTGNYGDPWEGVNPYPFTTPVGYYDGNQIINGIPQGVDMANGYGLYDMTGNTQEWCNDWYDANHYSVSPANNPTGPAAGTTHVIRDGNWHSGEWWENTYECGLRFSGYQVPPVDDDRHAFAGIGFRIVLDVE